MTPMSKLNTEENYYEILRVSPKASVSEITSAYMTAKNAFSKDSIATYSLMGSDETAKALADLEKAYMTLINPARRHEYDKELSSSQVINLDVATTSTREKLPTASPVSQSPQAIPEPPPALEARGLPADPIVDGGPLNLTQHREAQGYSLEDVSRITKIPTKYLKSIESYDIKTLPAKVYTQGFLRNLAQLYRLDPKKTVSSYFEQLEKLSGSVSA